MPAIAAGATVAAGIPADDGLLVATLLIIFAAALVLYLTHDDN